MVEQSLGAFPLDNGDISPLYVLFGLYNAGESVTVAEKVYLRAGRDTILDLTGEVGGDEGGLPSEIPPDDSTTLWLRARELAAKLREAGHSGTPKLGLMVVDSGGMEYKTTFKLRVDEYLQLKDE